MDNLNRFHTRTTFWIVRAEHIALLLVLSGLLIAHAGEVHWWRAAIGFWIIDIVGYLPGALMSRRSKTGQIPRGFYNAYNIAHTYLVTGTGVALWAYTIGGFEWAMLAVPIHLAIDRGIFGNTLKPAELSFEPGDHSDDAVLRALGRTNSPPPGTNGCSGAELDRLVPRNVLTETMEQRPEIGFGSYDWMFPNQDTLPKGGFGNLIALPLQRKPRAAGHSLFLDQKFQPYADQWDFLAALGKISWTRVELLAREAERRGRVLYRWTRRAPGRPDVRTIRMDRSRVSWR